MWGRRVQRREKRKQPLSFNNLSLLSWERGRGTSMEEIGVRGQRICSHQHPKMLACYSAVWGFSKAGQNGLSRSYRGTISGFRTQVVKIVLK